MATARENSAAWIRELYEVWNTQGPEGMRAHVWHPDIVWDEGETFPDASRFAGAGRVAERLAERLEVVDTLEVECVDYTPLSEARGLAELVVRGTGASSGAPIDFRWWHLLELAGEGRVTAVTEFIDRDAARRAAGLE
ncbi:MAG: nuclear transport factor 2 family protein [Thermoleophilaceae bacterium]|nr:nuclear transport factor 2 family protein [Thermoleophilaceae bacterium]